MTSSSVPSDANVPRSDSQSLFARRSSGLVRAFSTWDGFIYCIYGDSIIAAAALTYAVGNGFTHANIPLGIVIVCLAFMPAFTVYAMLATIMPRAGGDYVWQSRVLGGFWAFVLVFGPFMIGPWFYMASNVLPGATLVTAPLLVAFGNAFHADWLLSLASWVVTQNGEFVFFLIYTAFAFIVVALGLRFYAQFQRWSFYIGCIGIASWIVILLLSSHTQFVNSFDSYMQQVLNWGDGHAYQKVLTDASKAGYQPASFGDTNIKDTLLIGPVLAYTFLFVMWSSNLSGEISGLTDFRRSLRMYLGANLFALIVCAAFIWLLISRISNEFFQSANFIAATPGSSSIPVAPLYSLFLIALAQNPLLTLWIALTFSAWFWIWPTNNFVGSTRYMFGMSFDRMLPSHLSRVFGRNAVPIFALALAAVGMVFFGYLFYYTSFATLTLDLPLFASFAISGTCLAGALLPYMKSSRAIYASSPISKYTLLGIPLITVLGTVSLLYFAFMVFMYITDARYGVNSAVGYWFAFALAALGAIVYFGFKYYRKRQGIDVSRTYHEIPVD
jgi:basic amino acid/polyamine antiporter, APA family